jgi:ubiquinone/menaquinone biosynthesis C-methylase UbiE
MSSASPWYERAFRADYAQRYAHRDEAEAERAVAELVDTIGLEAVCCLDLCCGTGRHARSLARRGHRVVGLDLSEDLLSEASGNRELPIRWVRGSMDALPFRDSAFGLVVNFFTAFGYFTEDAHNFRVFSEVARVLEPGGWLVFDFLEADRVLQALSEGASPPETRENMRVTRRLSPCRRRVEKVYEHLGPDGEVRDTLVESVRLFRPEELRAALGAVGLRIRREAAGYAPGAQEGRWIAVCERVTSSR